MTWADDFAPESLNGFAGNPSAVGELKEWGGKPALLLAGPPGSGKTTAAIALARDKNWDLFELNASDLRSKKVLEKVAGLASVSSTFSGRRRMILFDEVDGLFRADYGGAGAILKIIRGAKSPIILTANDEYAKQLSSIRKECRLVKFKKVHYATIGHILEHISEAKGISAEPEALEKIARAAGGDIKAAINDFQAAATGRTTLSPGDVETMFRDRQDSIFNAMRTLFRTMDYGEAKRAFDGVQEDPDLFMKWVDENIPREYGKPADIAAAFEALSKADRYRGRIYRHQQWALMKFQIAMMTAGVALAKGEPYHGFTPYQYPTFIRKLFASKSKRTTQKAVAKKIGGQIHSSPHEVLSMHWPYLQLLAKKNPAGYAKQFNLDEKELEVLGVTKAAAKKALAL